MILDWAWLLEAALACLLINWAPPRRPVCSRLKSIPTSSRCSSSLTARPTLDTALLFETQKHEYHLFYLHQLEPNRRGALSWIQVVPCLICLLIFLTENCSWLSRGSHSRLLKTFKIVHRHRCHRHEHSSAQVSLPLVRFTSDSSYD